MPATALLAMTVLTGCAEGRSSGSAATAADGDPRLAKYATVRLTTDMGRLTERERTLLGLLVDACEHMNELFWQQAYGGDRNALLASITDDATKQYVMINSRATSPGST